MMFAQVIVDIAHEAVDRVFTYRVPEGMELQVGMRVRVPFGPRQKEGYILGFSDDPGMDIAKVKSVIAHL